MIDQFHRLVAKRINDVLDANVSALAAGQAFNGAHPIDVTYAKHVGYISGLRDALEMCAEVEKKMYGDDNAGVEGHS